MSVDAAAQYGGVRTAASAERAVQQVKACGVEGVIINGDVAWMAGSPQDYEVGEGMLGALADHGPLITSPGNHDNRENLCAVFSDPRMDEGAAKVMTVVDAGAVRLVCLDSLRRADVVSGMVGQAQLTWLDEFLATHGDKPAALFVHHPLDDAQNGLLDAPELLGVLRKHDAVKVIFTAHDHLFAHREQEGLLVVAQPAVGFPFEAGAMHGWLEAEFNSDGVSLMPWPIQNGPQKAVRLTWLR
jgi:3',5'-cyclic AMP phosphodiesterase CpdA